MPGPKTPIEARKWIRAAMLKHQYKPSVHLLDRCVQYKLTILDVRRALDLCSFVEPYADPPRHDGSCWRVTGKTIDGDKEIRVGVETYLKDDAIEYVMICTVIDDKKENP